MAGCRVAKLATRELRRLFISGRRLGGAGKEAVGHGDQYNEGDTKCREQTAAMGEREGHRICDIEITLHSVVHFLEK